MVKVVGVKDIPSLRTVSAFTLPCLMRDMMPFLDISLGLERRWPSALVPLANWVFHLIFLATVVNWAFPICRASGFTTWSLYIVSLVLEHN